MKVLFFIVAFVSAPTLAQDLNALPACAQTCALNAIGGSGCAVTDLKCICESASFISSYTSCITTSCGAADQAAAISFAIQYCASAIFTLSSASATLSAQASSTTASAL
ncbi:hypothetical protein BKA67DRAFT_657329 [Truncatella angustata]|uniref:CFEM domain-containing protein n=1 Tax=Truncatella angustata TaxID=152316 RepID=A0A9P8UNN1_9PEZI|nr:uncharacterized protein BKA67DRAFT_657329 [Truncatella angustata]KAH6655385.1 hypothetical protein BKA67DRAFT_657329 [Truncatella angustata]